MKKKLVCILLCAVLLVSGIMSTGCAVATDNTTSTDTSGTEGTEITTRSSITLSLWVPTDESTTEEALYAVEEAINLVTQAEYDTAVKLYAIPDGEYDATIKDRLETIKTRVEEEEQAAIKKRQEQIDAAQKGETYVEQTTEFVNPNMDGDYSLVVRGATGYTNIERNQLDIFLIRGEEDYSYYADNFYIQDLSAELSSASKVLNSYIYPDFFEAAKIDGSIYAVPNNHAVSEYTYFLVNKNIVDSEYLDPTRLTNLSNCEELIGDIVEYYPDVTPIYGNFDPAYFQFWSGQGGGNAEFSVLASNIRPDTKPEDVTFDNIFSHRTFTSNYYLYKYFDEQGYVNKSETVPSEFGVGFITCTQDEIKEYEDQYYINNYQRPEGEKSDYLQSMFAVSTYSKSLPRSMEIIELLNTDTTLRTILQYGAEGTHWKYDEENPDVIVKLDHMDESGTDLTYKMNLLDTGNVYMTYPDFGVGLDYWDGAKSQNLDSYFPVTSNFNYLNEDNTELFAKLDALSASIYSRMQSMTAEEFNAAISTFETEVNNSDAFQKLVYIPSDSDAGKGRTEENGWKASASLASQWLDYCIELYGEEFLNW